jgi:hypothetical protein
VAGRRQREAASCVICQAEDCARVGWERRGMWACALPQVWAQVERHRSPRSLRRRTDGVLTADHYKGTAEERGTAGALGNSWERNNEISSMRAHAPRADSWRCTPSRYVLPCSACRCALASAPQISALNDPPRGRFTDLLCLGARQRPSSPRARCKRKFKEPTGVISGGRTCRNRPQWRPRSRRSCPWTAPARSCRVLGRQRGDRASPAA